MNADRNLVLQSLKQRRADEQRSAPLRELGDSLERDKQGELAVFEAGLGAFASTNKVKKNAKKKHTTAGICVRSPIKLLTSRRVANVRPVVR